jgi:hypothetical protein
MDGRLKGKLLSLFFREQTLMQIIERTRQREPLSQPALKQPSERQLLPVYLRCFLFELPFKCSHSLDLR